jgi:hypothetical protein
MSSRLLLSYRVTNCSQSPLLSFSESAHNRYRSCRNARQDKLNNAIHYNHRALADTGSISR